MTPAELGQLIATGEGASEVAAYAAAGGDVNAIEPRSGLPLLHFACTQMNLDAAHALVTAGTSLEAEDSLGRTALHVAVEMDITSVTNARGPLADMQFEIACLLLALGARRDARNHAGETPRDVAAGHGEHVLDKFDRETNR